MRIVFFHGVDEFRQEREHILEDHNHDKSDDQQAVFDNGVNAAAELFHDDEIHELKDDSVPER